MNLDESALISRSAGDSRSRRLSRAAFSRGFLTVLYVVSFGAFFSFAQDNFPPVISKVEVWVDGLSNGESMENLISLEEGDPFSLKTVSENIKQIYRTGLFSDIQVLKSGDERVQVRFMLTRKLVLRKVQLQGNTGVSRRKLKDSLFSLRADMYFSSEKLNRAVEEVKRVLKREGYFQPDIEATYQRIENAPEVDVILRVNAGERFAVDAIRFQGNGIIPEEGLRQKMKSRIGDLYIPDRLERDLSELRKIYEAMGYRRVEVDLAAEEFNNQSQRVSLTLKITPNEKIDIVIKGADVPAQLVQQIWEERIFEEWGLSEGEARILSYLRDKGFILASVKSSIERADSEIKVIHEISPGLNYKIQEVRFEGNSRFTTQQLRDELAIPRRSLFFPVIDGKRAFELPQQIRRLYETQGYLDVEVNLTFMIEKKTAVAMFFIREGEQQKVKEIAFSGVKLFATETLRSEISLVEGGPFFAPAVQRDAQRIETFYLNQGVRGTRIAPRAEEIGGRLFRVNFDIQEGHRVKIKSVVITGNISTRRSTIQREIKIKAGEDANTGLIMASKSNLEKLGIFSEVKVEEILVSKEEENLVFTVREGEKNYVGLGVGLETRDAPFTSTVLETNLSLRGTAEFMRTNVLGRAASLSFVGQFSLQEKRAVVSWQEPYFLFNFPIETYFNAWIEARDRISFDYEGEGVSLTGIRPILEDLTLLMTMRYARTTLTNLEVSPSEIDREFSAYSITSASASFIREKRNDAFNPGKGYFASVVFEYAFPLFDTESDFTKTVFKYQHFLPLFPRVTLGSTFRLGLGSGQIPIHERFFAGGSYSFRGERFDELGPKDPTSGNPVGGKAIALFNFDLTFPVVASLKNLSGAVFFDAGNVFVDRRDLDLGELECALGFGARYRTPIGPVRLELGWNLTNPERRGKALIFVTIGNVF